MQSHVGNGALGPTLGLDWVDRGGFKDFRSTLGPPKIQAELRMRLGLHIGPTHMARLASGWDSGRQSAP
jgi:hypothetical protein